MSNGWCVDHQLFIFHGEVPHSAQVIILVVWQIIFPQKLGYDWFDHQTHVVGHVRKQMMLHVSADYGMSEGVVQKWIAGQVEDSR